MVEFIRWLGPLYSTPDTRNVWNGFKMTCELPSPCVASRTASPTRNVAGTLYTMFVHSLCLDFVHLPKAKRFPQTRFTLPAI